MERGYYTTQHCGRYNNAQSDNACSNDSAEVLGHSGIAPDDFFFFVNIKD